MKRIRITSLDELFSEVGKGNTDYFIMLNYGLCSSKYITEGEMEGTLCVLNLIDDTKQVLDRAALNDGGVTNIGRAIRNGAFYMCKED